MAGGEGTLQQTAALAGVSPEAAVTTLDNFDLDDAARDQSQIVGLPASYLRSVQERDAVRAQRGQMQRQQQEMAMMSQVAESAGKAAPALTAVSQAASVGQQGQQAA